MKDNLFTLIIGFIKQQIAEIGLGKYLLSVFLTIVVSLLECAMVYGTVHLFGINVWFGIAGVLVTLASIFGIYKLLSN